MRSALAVLLVVGPAVAAPVPKEIKKPDDKAAMLGTWVIGKATVDGKEVARYDPEHTMTFAADGVLTFKYPDSADQTATWELDPAASPKKLTMTFRAGAGKLEEAYQFRDGRLVLAWSSSGQAMPASLEPGPGVKVIEYKRADAK